MKSLKTAYFVIFLIVFVSTSNAQTIPENIKSKFKGTWTNEQYGHTNTIVIKFEKGKNYATFLDIGTGESPTETFQARVKKNFLFIPAKHHRNDVNIEMEVIKGKLHFREQLVIWDAKGNAVVTKNDLKTVRIFDRIRQ